MQPLIKLKIDGGVASAVVEVTGPDAVLRAAAEKPDRRRPVAEAGLGGGFPAEVV